MQKCLNCGSTLTCGCQRRSASDGTITCSKCIADYEKTLSEKIKTSNSSQDINKDNNTKNKT